MTPSIFGPPRLAASAPLFPVAIAFAGGIFADNLFSAPFQLSAITVAVFILAATFVVKKRLRYLLILAAVIAFGSLVHRVRSEVIAPDSVRRMCDDGRLNPGDPVGLEGFVRDVPEDAPGGLFFELETALVRRRGIGIPASGRVRVFVAKAEEGMADDIAAGDKLRVYCAPNRADEFLNPGVKRRTEILERLGLDASCSVKSELLVEKLGPAQGLSPVNAVRAIRAALIRRFLRAFNVPTEGVMIASLLGSKRYLDKSTATVFRDGGTFHVLVISGLHITFIGGIVLAVVSFATRRRGVRFVVTSTILWGFAIAVGADVPVVRAALMFTVVLFADVVFREPHQLNSLGLGALILLVWRPDDLFSQSFQLTFASVAAIVAGAFPLLKSLRAIGEWRPAPATPFPPNVSRRLAGFCETLYWRESKWEFEAARNVWKAGIVKRPFFISRIAQTAARLVFEGTLVSAIVQLTLLPLSVLFFNRISTASVILNLWVGVLIAAETFAACAAIVVREVSETLALPLVRLTELLNSLMLAVPSALIALDWAGFRVPAYTGNAGLIYAFYFIPVAVLFAFALRWQPFELQPRKHVAVWSVTTIMLLFFVAVVVLHPFIAPAPDGRLRIDFLDVGQGDSALITFPDGRTMLVDGGGRPQIGRINTESDDGEPFAPDSATVGEAVVSKFLWSRGLSRVDFIVATHADADHIQGLGDVAANFEVGTAFFGRTPAVDPDFAEVKKVLERRRVPMMTLARGDSMNIGGVEVEVLWPESSDGGASENNDSVVLRLRFGARTFLLTGDIERGAETALPENGWSVKCDLIKVAHHGSRTSSTAQFVDATAADFAVFSVGRRSRFGHPHPEIVDRWRRAGAKVLMTGQNGTVTVSTDGRAMSVTTYLGQLTE